MKRHMYLWWIADIAQAYGEPVSPEAFTKALEDAHFKSIVLREF